MQMQKSKSELKGRSNGKQIGEELAFICGWVSHEIQSFAESLGVPQQLVATRLAEFLSPEGMGHSVYVSDSGVRENATERNGDVEAPEMAAGSHSDGPRLLKRSASAATNKEKVMEAITGRSLRLAEIAEATGLQNKVVTYHLKRLREEGVLRIAGKGHKHTYRMKAA